MVVATVELVVPKFVMLRVALGYVHLLLSMSVVEVEGCEQRLTLDDLRRTQVRHHRLPVSPQRLTVEATKGVFAQLPVLMVSGPQERME